MKTVQGSNWILFSSLLILAPWEQCHARNFDLAFFTSLPPPQIYRSSDQLATRLTLVAQLSPANATVYAAIRRGTGPGDQLDRLSKVLQVFSGGENRVTLAGDRTRVSVDVPDWQPLVGRSLHWVAENSLGRVVSRPFTVVKNELQAFPNESDEELRFLKGNVGYASCQLPRSNPSPPQLVFLKNGRQLPKDIRYRTVYVPAQPPNNTNGRMVLLIRDLSIQDSGIYTCQAGLGKGALQVSSKRTSLKVEMPTRVFKHNFVFSAIPSNSEILVTEGSNVTLFCVFKAAPVVQVKWYYRIKDTRITVDKYFRTLTITGITLAEQAAYSCLPEEANAESSHVFHVRVKRRMKLKVEPSDVQVSNWGSPVSLDCELEPGDDKAKSPPYWIFNGHFIHPLKESNHYTITMTQLTIKNMQRNNIGVYQCYGADVAGGWMSKVVTVTQKSDTVIRKAIADILERSELTIKSTRQGLTGHLTCEVDKALRGHPPYTKVQLEVRWFRGAGPGSQIVDMTKDGDVKYMLNSKIFRHDTLSILNPNIPDDSGLYSCRIYNKTQNVLLGAARVKFVIVKEKSIEEKLTDTNENDNTQPTPSLPIENTPVISQPSTSRPIRFLPAVQLAWSLPRGLDKSSLDHFRVEYRHRTPSRRAKREINDNAFPSWSDVEMLPQIVKTTKTILYNPEILKPGFVYKFRVVSVPSYDQKGINLKSEWTRPVSFRHIQPFQPTIDTVKSLSSSELQISWNYDQTSFRVSKFQVICRPLPASTSGLSERILLEQSTTADVTKTVLAEREQSLWRINITGLAASTQYAVFLYGIQTQPIETFTEVSNLKSLKTLKHPMKDSQVNKIPRLDNDDLERKQLLFLILGSLAGVLFVVALVLVTMYVWHRLREKYPSRASTPPSFKSANQPLTSAHHPSHPPDIMNHHPHLINGWGTGSLPHHESSGQHPLLLAHGGGCYPLMRTQEGTVLGRDTGGGYLESQGPVIDYRHQQSLMRQQQADQASSIYSQVGSDHRGSTSALSGVGREPMYAHPPNDEAGSDEQFYTHSRSPNLQGGAPPYNPPIPFHPGFMPQYQDFFAMRGGMPGTLNNHDENTLNRNHAPVLPLSMSLSTRQHGYHNLANGGSPYLYHSQGNGGWLQVDDRVCPLPLPPPSTTNVIPSPRVHHVQRSKDLGVYTSTPNNNIYNSQSVTPSSISSVPSTVVT